MSTHARSTRPSGLTRLSQFQPPDPSALFLLIMLDCLKRLILGTDSRQVDVSMLIIEFLVLLLILLEVVWQSKDRWERKKHKNAVLDRLNALSKSEADMLSSLVLHGSQPTTSAKSTESPLESLTRPLALALVERDYFTGWRVARDNKTIIVDWVNKRRK